MFYALITANYKVIIYLSLALISTILWWYLDRKEKKKTFTKIDPWVLRDTDGNVIRRGRPSSKRSKELEKMWKDTNKKIDLKKVAKEWDAQK